MSDFKVKMHQNRFRLGLCPRPHWGILQHSPRSPTWNKGALLLRGWEGKGRGRRGREGRGGEVRGGKDGCSKREGKGKGEMGGRGGKGRLAIPILTCFQRHCACTIGDGRSQWLGGHYGEPFLPFPLFFPSPPLPSLSLLSLPFPLSSPPSP